MNIGIDLDGVLFDTEREFNAQAHFYSLDVLGHGAIKTGTIIAQEKFGLNSGESSIFIKSITESVETNAPFMPGAIEATKRLKQLGHKLFIVSARGKWGDIEVEVTKKRLKQANLNFDDYFYYQTDKAKTCKEKQIEYMIDDSPTHIKNLAKNHIKSLYFRTIATEKIKSKFVTEVHEWSEVYEYFLNLKNS